MGLFSPTLPVEGWRSLHSQAYVTTLDLDTHTVGRAQFEGVGGHYPALPSNKGDKSMQVFGVCCFVEKRKSKSFNVEASC